MYDKENKKEKNLVIIDDWYQLVDEINREFEEKGVKKYYKMNKREAIDFLLEKYLEIEHIGSIKRQNAEKFMIK